MVFRTGVRAGFARAHTQRTGIGQRHSPKGQRCAGYSPLSQRQTTTLVCALRESGLIAPCVLDGAINGQAFVAWIKRMCANSSAIAAMAAQGENALMFHIHPAKKPSPPELAHHNQQVMRIKTGSLAPVGVASPI